MRPCNIILKGVSPNEAAGRAIQLVKSGRFYTPEVETQVDAKTDSSDDKDSISESIDVAQRQRYDSACTRNELIFHIVHIIWPILHGPYDIVYII